MHEDPFGTAHRQLRAILGNRTGFMLDDYKHLDAEAFAQLQDAVETLYTLGWLSQDKEGRYHCVGNIIN